MNLPRPRTGLQPLRRLRHLLRPSRHHTPIGRRRIPSSDQCPWNGAGPPRAKSASPPPAKPASGPGHAARVSIDSETPQASLRASTSPPRGDAPMKPELAPSPAELAPESLSGGLTSGPKCPLGRVAMVRGSDSEASEGGGFNAARKNGIHGAVDLNGSLGEAVFAVANGKVVMVGDWGKLGKTVILDHRDGGYTIYGHLHTVDVKLHSSITAGQMLGTMGYSGNAKRLQAKNLPPHLHFAYVRGFAPLARIRDSVDGLGASFTRDDAVTTGVLHPMRAVGFHKCWEDPTPATRASTPSPVAMP